MISLKIALLIIVALLLGTSLVINENSTRIYYSVIDSNQYITLYSDNTFEYQGINEKFGGRYKETEQNLTLIANTFGIEYWFKKVDENTLLGIKNSTWKK